MDLIYIESTTFERMMEHLDSLAVKVDRLAQAKEEKRLNGRFDGQDVCQLLRISPRTLQSLRSNGSLPYTQINRKIWYNPSDVEKLIGKVFDLK